MRSSAPSPQLPPSSVPHSIDVTPMTRNPRLPSHHLGPPRNPGALSALVWHILSRGSAVPKTLSPLSSDAYSDPGHPLSWQGRWLPHQTSPTGSHPHRFGIYCTPRPADFCHLPRKVTSRTVIRTNRLARRRDCGRQGILVRGSRVLGALSPLSQATVKGLHSGGCGVRRGRRKDGWGVLNVLMATGAGDGADLRGDEESRTRMEL